MPTGMPISRRSNLALDWANTRGVVPVGRRVFRVATASGLVMLKLFNLRRVQDEADVVALIKTGQVDLSGWPLPPERVSAFQRLVEIAKSDPD
jgi:hypothetical protein